MEEFELICCIAKPILLVIFISSENENKNLLSSFQPVWLYRCACCSVHLCLSVEIGPIKILCGFSLKSDSQNNYSSSETYVATKSTKAKQNDV